jgi:hypothetical protein
MWIQRLTTPISNLGAGEIAMRLTAVDLLLRPMGPWGVRPLILVLAGLTLILPRVLRSPLTWYVLAVLIAARIAADWPLPDNHIYLLVYWCLAVGLALATTGGTLVLSKSSRLLIGFAFLMAVVWKGLLSPDYLDGRFFRVTLMTDDRFGDVAMLFGGLSEADLAENREYLMPLPEGAELFEGPELAEPAAFSRLATVSTWGVFGGELLVAVSFLVPMSGRKVLLRHAVLLAFCVVTYAFAPVAGFGWLLLVMGLASCGADERRLVRGAYIVTWFAVLIFSEVPWSGILNKWLGNG